MINATSYDYIVFYYDISDFAEYATLKSLFAQKITQDKGAEASIAEEDSDIMTFWLKEACDQASSKLLAYSPTDVVGYQYGVQNIDPDAPSGDQVVFRACFLVDKLQDGILQKIDSSLLNYIATCVKASHALETGSEDYSKTQLQKRMANESLERAIDFRKIPPTINAVNF